MDILNEVWATIAPYFTGVTVAGVLSTIIYGVLKGAFNKTISKINVEKISETATERGIDKIKNISFTQTIQPLVESELKKVTEQANEYIKNELKTVETKYDNLVAVIKNLSAYFDNSIGVSEEAKGKLKEAIAKAENKPVEPQKITVETVEPKEDKKAVKDEIKPPKTVKVER